MDAQIIIAVVATGIAGMAVVVTLCLALLRGFRGLHDKIDNTAKGLRGDNAALAKELRGDNAALAKELRGNSEDIAEIKGRLTVIENVLNTILHAILPRSGHFAASSSATTDVHDAVEEEAGDGAGTKGRVACRS